MFDGKHPGGRPRKAIPKTTTPPANSRYYTIAELEQITGLHRHTLQARLRDGTIKGKLIGRTWRIYPDELYQEGK
jgi:excisionase family DNA binding protein